MEYIATVIAVLNDYLEYSLHDNHTVNLLFQSTSMHVFHACCSVHKMLCWQRHDMVFILVHSLNFTD